MKNVTKAFALLTVLIFVAGCGGGGGGDSGGSASGLSQISDKYSARDVVGNLHDSVTKGVLQNLSNGTYQGTIVNGITGTATVTGSQTSSTGQSCGTDCVRSTYSVNVTIVFSNCTVQSLTNAKTTINGTIKYVESSSSTQSGTSHSSSESISMSSTGPVQVTEVVQGYSGTWGYQDTVTFSAGGSNPYLLTGTCTAGNGVTYSF